MVAANVCRCFSTCQKQLPMPKREARPNARVGLHAAEHYAKPLEKLFVEFVRPLTRTKCGNSAILFVLGSVSKFVTIFPVRRMASSVVIDCLEKGYFPAYGTPMSIVTHNARVFRSKEIKELCFRWGDEHIYTTLNTLRLRLQSECTGTSNQR